MVFLQVCLLFLCYNAVIEATSRRPRIFISNKDPPVKRFGIPDHQVPVWMNLTEQPDTVIVAGQKQLISFNFHKTPPGLTLQWQHCDGAEPCNYNITVVHKSQYANKLFVFGTDGRSTSVCCDMDLSEKLLICKPSEKLDAISNSMNEFIMEKGEPSALVESAEGADFYITYSGSAQLNGLYKFGKDRVGPSNHKKAHQYVGLMVSRQDGYHQDKVYGFYKEKNSDPLLYRGMWLPFVTQVCMADTGGTKNNLQFMWTSQMNARLFCKNPNNSQFFSELVDVATVHADKWMDSKVYVLFRNEWGMSAVCVYTIKDIDHVFKTSQFKGGKSDSRSRTCVKDSKEISSDVLRMIESTSEMDQSVHPVNDSGPLITSYHNYTRIQVDNSKEHVILFLSLNNGDIHKMIKNQDETFIIAAYQSFTAPSQVVSMLLHPSPRKLYVASKKELVQLDVANCSQYGQSCEDCVLARDPYCGWNGTDCTRETSGTVQDVARGNHAICATKSPGKALKRSTKAAEDDDLKSISIPSRFNYFLQCPVTSHHAQYTWKHPGGSTRCHLNDHQCLHLIENMGPEHAGMYKCESEEMGHIKVLAEYNIRHENGAVGRSSGPLVWVCLMLVLIKSLSF